MAKLNSKKQKKYEFTKKKKFGRIDSWFFRIPNTYLTVRSQKTRINIVYKLGPVKLCCFERSDPIFRGLRFNKMG